MKKLLPLLFGFMLSISISQAQKQSKFEVGFQGGWVLGNANGSAVDNPSKDVLSGVGFGLNIKRNLKERFALKLGINYEQMGWAYRNMALVSTPPDPGSFFSYADILQRQSYINVPVLAEYSFGNKLQLHLNAGPFIGFLVKSNTTIDYKNDQLPDEKSSNKNIKPFIAGVATGLGLSYPLTSTLKVNLQGSQQFGLMNVGKNASASTTKLRSFSITTGLSFSL